MKIPIKLKNNKKKVLLIAILIVMVVAIAAVITFFYIRSNGGLNQSPMQFDGMINGNFISEDMITASGVTSVGTKAENFEVENLETELEIEEILVSSNQIIEEGTAILKLSEESLAKARKELEKEQRESQLAYRAGAIEYEQSKITAKYDCEQAILKGEQAKEIYNDTISLLEENVEKAQKELDEAKKEIEEYKSMTQDSTYAEYYKVDEYKALYEENKKLLMEKMEEWGVGWEQVVNTSFNGQNNFNNEYISVLSSLYSVLEQNGKDLELAQTDFDDAVINAEFELQTLELKLSSLEQAVAEAKRDKETNILEAKLTYETSLANAQRAEKDYATALEKAEADYTSLEDAKTDAEGNLNLFEESVGDGYYYALGSGTLLRTMVRKGSNLISDSTIFMYSNSEELTVTVSVDQADISKVSIGDDAFVEASGYGSFQGVVTEINPISTSSSRASVTYNVTVTLSGDISSLATNQTVTVIFGLGGDSNE